MKAGCVPPPPRECGLITPLGTECPLVAMLITIYHTSHVETRSSPVGLTFPCHPIACWDGINITLHVVSVYFMSFLGGILG